MLRLIENVAGNGLHWHNRTFYSTVETIDKLPSDVKNHLIKLCQPYQKKVFWKTMHQAMQWFTELAHKIRLHKDIEYPHKAEIGLPKYAYNLEKSTAS